MKIGILPLGRPTFDVPFANDKLHAMLAALEDYSLVGNKELLMDAQSTHASLQQLQQQAIDLLLILQVTFTDASMIVEAAKSPLPIAIWAVPEPRFGGRLRLNALCGLNLASHALGLRNKPFSWLYEDPDTVTPDKLDTFLQNRQWQPLQAHQSTVNIDDRAQQIVANIAHKRIGRIGQHPAGFDTCAYNPQQVEELAGVVVDAIELNDFLNLAKTENTDKVEQTRKKAQNDVDGLHKVDPEQLDKSLRMKCALDTLQVRGNYDAFAIRCWPEVFTEYGGAVCGPCAMLSEAGIPCACEADVFGALTQLVLRETTNDVVFLTDLVDVDVQDNSAVFWHCGQAPVSMRSQSSCARATVHTNRKMPLLYEFALKPGEITLMRISQSYNTVKMVLCGGTVLDRPMAFTGTSGVVRFHRPAQHVINDIIASGLEHHMAIAYGDYRDQLRAVATAMSLPVLEL